ncbi:MAG: hypothetical protein NW206_05855, partial [Hyphomonadaceae bacterium]|nr:hypothetical protein [Hyphomonadaceae bacterium]
MKIVAAPDPEPHRAFVADLRLWLWRCAAALLELFGGGRARGPLGRALARLVREAGVDLKAAVLMLAARPYRASAAAAGVRPGSAPAGFARGGRGGSTLRRLMRAAWKRELAGARGLGP